MMPGMTEIIIVLVIVIILFGGKKIPEIAKGLGKGIKDFKKAIKDDESKDKNTTQDKIEESNDKK